MLSPAPFAPELVRAPAASAIIARHGLFVAEGLTSARLAFDLERADGILVVLHVDGLTALTSTCSDTSGNE